MSEKNHLTIVIQYEGKTPPVIPDFGSDLLGGKVTGLATGDCIDQVTELENKLDETDLD